MISVPQNTAVLPVMEAFYTIQGEGFHQGKAAYFIRLGGCDVGCIWCDVKESWDPEKHPLKSTREIVDESRKFPVSLAVVTGGEPLMHQLDGLTTTLHEAGFYICLETSGAYPMSGDWDWICISPKKFKAPLPENLPMGDELKVVIYHKTDLAWAEKYAAQMKQDCKLYLQPEWGKASVITPLIVEYIKSHPKWELSLQIHKYIDVP